MKGALALALMVLLPTPLAAQAAASPTAPDAGVVRAADPVRRRLENGLRILVKPVPATEVVAVELLLDISACDEPEGGAGIRELMERCLLRAGAHAATGSPQSLASFGGSLSGSVGLDYVELYALTPADGLEVALEALGAAVRRPQFLPEEVEEERQALTAAVRAAEEDAFQTTYGALRQALYGQHPYGRPTTGERASVAFLSSDEVAGFYASHCGPNAAVLTICGGVSPGRATRAARRVFADWEPCARQVRPPLSVEPIAASGVVAREGPFGQAHMMLGFPAPAVEQADYYPLQVVDSLLAGRSGALLPKALREETGLAYDVSSFYPTLAQTSHLAIYLATEPYRLEEAKAAVLEALRKLSREPVPPDELEGAKRSLVGSYALSSQRMKEQAHALAWYELLGLGAGFEERYLAGVQAVTPADVQAAAQATLGRFVIAVALPAQ